MARAVQAGRDRGMEELPGAGGVTARRKVVPSWRELLGRGPRALAA